MYIYIYIYICIYIYTYMYIYIDQLISHNFVELFDIFSLIYANSIWKLQFPDRLFVNAEV